MPLGSIKGRKTKERNLAIDYGNGCKHYRSTKYADGILSIQNGFRNCDKNYKNSAWNFTTSVLSFAVA